MISERCAHAHLRTLIAVLSCAALAAWADSAQAAEPAIWYRGGEGCPDGASFLGQLERRGVRARLAEVGDRIDFVVTLGASGGKSSGRLERQTSQGTIAIRQVEDVRCDAVAEALALTLALSQDPAAEDSTAGNPEPALAATSVSPALAPAPLPAVAPAAKEPSASADTPPPKQPRESMSTKQKGTFAIGLGMLAADVFEGPWLLSVGPFVELEAPASFALPRATVRAALSGGFRAEAGASVRVWLAAVRIEGCPVAFAWGSVALRPCLALDSGALGASAAGVADVGFWFSAAAHARLAVAFGQVGLEAQAGGVVPITQYEVTSPATTLEKTRTIGFAAGLGASYRFE